MKFALAAVVTAALTPEFTVRSAGLSDTELRAETFQQCFEQIRPQAGESRWLDVPWLIDLHEARRKAAAEGKPLFIQAAGKANSLGPC